MNKAMKWGAVSLAAVATMSMLAGCSSNNSNSTGSAAGSGKGTIQVWAHQGQDSENAVIQAAVDGFNSSQSDIKAVLTLQPEKTYTSTISNTPADQLPDVMELDGPTLASYVYNGKVTPIKDYIPSDTLANATDGSVQEGTYNNNLYGLAMYNSALGLCGNKSMLDAAGVTYPTSISSAWTPAQFSAALQKLSAASSSGKALTINESYGLASEWGTFAFSPLIQSAGGNLIQDNKATGVLNSSASVGAMTSFASWKPYTDSDSDGKAFTSGQVALTWCGHWMIPGINTALGASNVVDLPLPNMGNGSKTGAGSWTWGMGAKTQNGTAAGKFLAYLLNDTNVTAMTTANGAPAATKSVFATQTAYQSGGELALWGQQLQNSCNADSITSSCVAVLRPITPGYPTITSEFGKALSAIWTGSDPQTSLTNAATAIDQNFSDNNNYQQ